MSLSTPNYTFFTKNIKLLIFYKKSC